MTELYPLPNEQRDWKGAVPVTNIDFFSRKSSLPTGSIGFQIFVESMYSVVIIFIYFVTN